jgi:hypothetical protein
MVLKRLKSYALAILTLSFVEMEVLAGSQGGAADARRCAQHGGGTRVNEIADRIDRISPLI